MIPSYVLPLKGALPTHPSSEPRRCHLPYDGACTCVPHGRKALSQCHQPLLLCPALVSRFQMSFRGMVCKLTVDLHLAVGNHLLDLTLLLEILEGLSCERTVDL
jgi:hypothetical protein